MTVVSDHMNSSPLSSETEKITIRINTVILGRIARVVAAAVIALIAYKACMAIWMSHVEGRAIELLDAGYPHLAFEEIEPHHERFVSDDETCGLLLDTALAAERYERAEWAYEACKRNKINSFPVHFAKARLELHRGGYERAIRDLYDLRDFHRPKVSELLVETLLRHKYDTEAKSVAEDGLRAFPDDAVLRALTIQINLNLKHPDVAVRAAEPFKRQALAGSLPGNFFSLTVAAYAAAGDKATVEQLKASRQGRPDPNSGAGNPATDKPATPMPSDRSN